MNVTDLFQIVANVAVAGSLVFLGLQILQSRKERRHDIYERVNTEWIQHMSRILADPDLEKIWDKFDESRVAEFREAELENEKAEGGATGGAWSVMDVTEKKCYRYLRVALEIFELAFQSRRSGVKIPKELAAKWDNQIRVFLNSPYFGYVFEDTRERLDDRFENHIESLKGEPVNPKNRFG